MRNHKKEFSGDLMSDELSVSETGQDDIRQKKKNFLESPTELIEFIIENILQAKKLRVVLDNSSFKNSVSSDENDNNNNTWINGEVSLVDESCYGNNREKFVVDFINDVVKTPNFRLLVISKSKKAAKYVGLMTGLHGINDNIYSNCRVDGSSSLDDLVNGGNEGCKVIIIIICFDGCVFIESN